MLALLHLEVRFIARHDPDLHWVQIHAASYPQLPALLAAYGTPTQAELPGPSGEATWHLTIPAAVLSDAAFEVAGHALRARLYTLPSHIYQATVAASPEFQQYPGLEELYQLMITSDIDLKTFETTLRDVVACGRVPDQLPRLVSPTTTLHAQWLPLRTFVRRTPAGHFFLGLSYQVQYVPLPGQRRTLEVGLDLGYDPLTVAYAHTGEIQRFRPHDLRHLTALPRPTGQALELLRVMLYARGRADTEGVIDWLIRHARVVYAERLTHQAVHPDWIRRGRDLAIHDHHFSALSQALFAAGVPFKRVSSWHSSQVCGRCLQTTGREVLGQRTGRVFVCTRCGCQSHSDINGAHVILLRGQQRFRSHVRTG